MKRRLPMKKRTSRYFPGLLTRQRVTVRKMNRFCRGAPERKRVGEGRGLRWVADEEEVCDEEEDEPVIPWVADEEEGDGEEDEPVLPWVADEEEDVDEEGDEPVLPWIADEAECDGEEDEPVLPWVADEEEEQPAPEGEHFANLFEQANPDQQIGDNQYEPNLFSSVEDEDPESRDHGYEDEASREESSSATPMWKSFLERADEKETPHHTQEETYKNAPEEVPGTPDSHPDLFGETTHRDDPGGVAGKPGDSESDLLARWLKKDEKRYMKRLFKNSRTAYLQALTDLTIFDDWKSAAGYLEREIFAKNNVDLFSETAVDFTDKLHSFFIKFKS